MSETPSDQSLIERYGSLLQSAQFELSLTAPQACSVLKVYDVGFNALTAAETDLFFDVIRAMKLKMTL